MQSWVLALLPWAMYPVFLPIPTGQGRQWWHISIRAGRGSDLLYSYPCPQVKGDDGGMSPSELDDVLTRAKAKAAAEGAKPPKLLYTVRITRQRGACTSHRKRVSFVLMALS